MLKLFRNKLFIGAVCLLLAGILAFVFLPRLYSAQSGTTEIVKLRQTVEYGTVITYDMLTVSEVGSYGLPDDVVTDKSEIVGLVAGSTIYAGEYVWSERFITEETYENAASKSGYDLSDGTYLLTVSLPSESSGLAGILRAGDTVDVYGYSEDDGSAVVSKTLTGITVYEVLNDDMCDIMVRADDAVKINRIMERFSLATVDTATIKTEIEKSRADKEEPIKDTPADKDVEAFLDELMGDEPKQQQNQPNPTTAAPVKSTQSEPSSQSKKVKVEATERHSIREELRTIKAEQKQKVAEPEAERRVEEKPRGSIHTTPQSNRPKRSKNKTKKERS